MANSERYTVGWICAISTEFVAAQTFLDEEHEEHPVVAQKDNNSYAFGRIGKHNVVVAVLPDGEYGISAAAAVARDLLHSFPNVRIGLMVGIGGGAPTPEHDIRLGDVVVSSRDGVKGGVFQYDFGKTMQNHDIPFRHTDFLDQPPTVLRTAVSALRTQYKRKGHQLDEKVKKALERWPRLRLEYSKPLSEEDRLFRSDVIHPDSSDECNKVCSIDSAHLKDRPKRGENDDDPTSHYGLIASANRLMKNASIRDTLAKQHGILCFEMEAAGLMNHFPCLVVRGICDYSDSHKNDRWQGFAAMTAAAYAADLLRQIPVNKLDAEKAIKDVLGQIHKEFSLVNDAVVETKTAIIAFRDDLHARKLYRWLSPADPSVNANRARACRHAGTGTWLLTDEVFHEWEVGKRQNLWLYGLAGCGKTILSTTIVDRLEETGSYLALKFFFDFNDARKQKLEDLLRSLAFQLYHTGAESAKALDSLFESCDDGRHQPDSRRLSACVRLMIESSQRVAIVLDALDECTTQRDLISWIGRLCSISITNSIKLIVTGRPEADLKRDIPPLFGEYNCRLLSKVAIDADIRSYVNYELSERPEFAKKDIPHDLLDQVRHRVGDRADGMFRWAVCQMDSLAGCFNSYEFQQALDSLPENLDETYERMLQSIPPRLRQAAFRLLHFLVHAKRPLTVSEAMDVVATLTDKKPPEFNKACRLYFQDDLLRYSPGLVSFAESTAEGITVREIRLAHFSVKEFLMEKSHFDLETASSVIAKTCFTYIRFIDCDYFKINAAFPLALYAAEVVMEHVRLVESSREIFEDAVIFFTEEAAFKRWAELYQSGSSAAQSLYFTCLTGLSRVSRYLVDEGADINAHGGMHGNALQAASHAGYTEIVRMLLEKKANVNAQGGDNSNALYTAAFEGHTDVVETLLEHRANVNALGGRYRYALQATILNGHTRVFEILVKNNADVNTQGEGCLTPLQAASLRGNLEMVQALIRNGANVNAKSGGYRTPLCLAAREGHADIVKTLLKNEAAAISRNSKDDAALEDAAQAGHADIVKLLLKSRAGVNSGGGHNFGSSLQIASRYGQIGIVRTLLEHQADVNARGGFYNNALQAASYMGHTEIARTLLEHGADVNIKGGLYGNALSAAAVGNHMDVVKVLLDHHGDVNAQGSGYGSALHAASVKGNTEIARLLLRHQADVNAQSVNHLYNALQAASSGGHLEIVMLLLQNGADIDAQGGYYGCALKAAMSNRHTEIVRILLEKQSINNV